MPTRAEIVKDVHLDIVGRSLLLTTLDGSSIVVRPNTLSLKNFMRYTDEQKSSWDLEHSVLAVRDNLLHLVVPFQTLEGAAWMPLVWAPTDDPCANQLLQLFACYTNILIERSLTSTHTPA